MDETFDMLIDIKTKDGEKESVFRAYGVSALFIINIIDKIPGVYGGALLDIGIYRKKEIQNEVVNNNPGV